MLDIYTLTFAENTQMKAHATIMHSNTTIENWRETEENVKVLTNILHKKFNSQIVNFKEDEMEEIGNNIILKYAN